MDLFKNVTIEPDQLASESGLGSEKVMTGGTANSMPGYSIADQSKDVLSEGAAGGELSIGLFKNMPNSSPDM